MSTYTTMPTDYVNDLFKDGSREKARAFFEYCYYLNMKQNNSISFYAESWSISKSTAHKWVKNFHDAIKKHHEYWLEENQNKCERLANEVRTAKPSIKPKKQGSKNKGANEVRTIGELSINNNINNNTLISFYEHRDTLKKPMSERAIILFVKKLVKLRDEEGYDIDLLIEEAIMNGWQTVYPKPENKAQTANGTKGWK